MGCTGALRVAVARCMPFCPPHAEGSLLTGMPQFWVNQKELHAAPERWKAGFARLRAMCDGSDGEHAGAAGKASKLAGTWTKVDTVGQDQAMLMLGLNVVFRKAAILLSKVVIKAEPTTFEVTTKGAMVVSIKERYGFDGAVSACSRRDKRWGKHKGKIVSASERKVCAWLRVVR